MDEARQMELLRRHEPILRFQSGERFFPMDVATFVDGASLWARAGSGAAERVRRAGQVTLESLGEVDMRDGRSTLFLRKAAPMSAAEFAQHVIETRRTRDTDPRDHFRAGRGRLARVGYASRLVDALFSLSLLARGRVPGDLAAAAAMLYREPMQHAPVYRYYGRVVHYDDWIVLQYWTFYAFNDWRSRFFGTNDHEGDWESIHIFLGPDGTDDLQPEWIVASCHDYPGVDLRRRWDDPALERRGLHPMIHVGAGSHAGYYGAGDYLAEVEIPALAPVSHLARRIGIVWREKLHQYGPDPSRDTATERAPSSIWSVPFVDYARGDGHVIGPGEEREWAEPGLITSPPGWIRNYRGLWGYYARDPLAGEDAPPGPMYERNGDVRLSWQDPVAWSGLETTPPRQRLPEIAARMREEAAARRGERKDSIAVIRADLLRLGVRDRFLVGVDRSREYVRRQEARREHLRKKLAGELRALAEEDDLLHRLEAGTPPTESESGMRSHIRRTPEPLQDERLRAHRLAEVWSALSVGALLLALGVLAVFQRERLVEGSVVLLSWLLVIEAFLRNRITFLVTGVTVGLALVCGAVLVVKFYQPLAIALAVSTGLFLLRENLREL